MVSRMYVDGLSASTYDTSSQTIILQLAKGDDVSVKNQEADENKAGNYYTTFCGFLLQQSLDEVSVVGKWYGYILPEGFPTYVSNMAYRFFPPLY